MSKSDETEAPLDAATIIVLSEMVARAKHRGWLKPDLTRWFDLRGVDPDTYRDAMKAKPISAEIRSALAAVSIHGLPDLPYAPNPEQIRQHLEWLIDPARGAYDDGLIEIAHGEPEGGPSAAQLFGFDELDAAVGFAVGINSERRNVYVGAALRLPDAPRDRRASAEDFYVATAVPVDIDANYQRTREAMAAVCEDGLVVNTGQTPEQRSQHWVRLTEPCDSDIDFAHAFRGLVEHIGADLAVKDAARVMRLGGTVAYPNKRKIDKGYRTELTTVAIKPDARPSDLARLRGLAASPEAEARRDYSDRPQGDGIERGGLFGAGKVRNGRERFFATKLLPRAIREHQAAHGADPSADQLFGAAFAIFCEEADNSDERWTCADGQRQLRSRADNTLRRLRLGRLAHLGLYSLATGVGKEEAERAQAERDAAHPSGAAEEAAKAEEAADEGPIRASTLTGEPPERRWIVPDWIIEGAVNSLYGDGGVGKTLLAQELAYAVSLGAPWLGLPTTQGCVLAVLCEDERGELHRRHAAIKAAMGYAVGNPFADAWLWPRVGLDNTLVRWDRDAKPVLPAFYEKLFERVRALRPSLLILDTLADIFGGNEIDRVQVNYFIKTVLGGLIREQAEAGASLTILLLGHPSVSGKTDGRGFSGSTAWNNAVRSRLYLTRPEDGDSDTRLLTRGKANYAKSGDETTIRLYFDDGVLHRETPANKNLLWEAKEAALALIERAWKARDPYKKQKSCDRNIYLALVADLARQGVGRDVARQAIDALIDDGLIDSIASDGQRGFKRAGK